MEVPKETKNTVTTQSGNLTPGSISREHHPWGRHIHSDIHCSTIYSSLEMQVVKMSMDRWIELLGTYMEENSTEPENRM